MGTLMIPEKAVALVLFAHGSGSSCHSPRNRFVAHQLEKANLATLLFDLLTAEEEKRKFDIPFLAKRLLVATAWAARRSSLPLCYFGASTGAAAALVAAAEKGPLIHAVVSRGGRPDLARSFLSKVQSPTLLIVGGDDSGVIELNEEALAELKCLKQLEVVPGATHLFEETGKLEIAPKLVANWFLLHGRKPRSDRDGA